MEPDFVVFEAGVFMVIEVDCDTVHQETPVEAHDREKMLLHEGALFEWVKASDCDTTEKAKVCASKLIQTLAKRKENARF